MALFVFGTGSTAERAYLSMILNKADGSGQSGICSAHVQGVSYGASSCSTLLKLNIGDQIWPVGDINGGIYAQPVPFSSFQAYLLYRDDALQ